MDKKRYFEFDRLNVLYCLIVVFIHVFGVYSARLAEGSIHQAVFSAFMKNCAFVVQGFMFLSSVKYSVIYKDKPLNYLRFIYGRIKKIILPYIFCVCVYYMVYLKIGYVGKFSIPHLIGYIFDGTLSAQFYFVIAVLQFYLLMPVWIFLLKKVNTLWIIGSGFLIYGIWLSAFYGKLEFFDRIFVSYLPFWVMGIAFGKNYPKFRAFMLQKKAWIIALFVLMYISNGLLKYIIPSHFIYLEAFHSLYAISAVLMTYSLSASKELGTLFGGVNNLSFDIYLWHCLALPFIDKLVLSFKLHLLFGEAALRGIIMYTAIFLVSFIYKRRRLK